VNGTQIDQLCDLIEETLQELGMSEAPWYCAVEPYAPRFREGGRASHGVRVIWRKASGVLDFFDESGTLLDSVRTDAERAVPAGVG
jgi:hypothetical protein